MAKRGDELRLTIERIVPGGDGLGFDDGRAVFVPLSAPGDELRVLVTEARGDYLRADIVDIDKPSPDRVEPACPLYGECGGCNLMHLSYEAQLRAKRGLVADAFRRAGGLPEAFAGAGLAAASGSPLGYRNRAQFHVGPRGETGYARRRGSSVLAVGACPVLVPELSAWLGEDRDATARRALAKSLAGKDRFVAFGYGGSVFLEGRDGEVRVDVAGRTIRFNVRGFFQSNLGLLPGLVRAVADGASGERAADLYAGVGLFGAFLKDGFGTIACVEQEALSIGSACANVGEGATYAATSTEEWTKTKAAGERFDYVVVDPPRAGLAPVVRAWLADRKPGLIGYVSCDPVSLARDAGQLVAAGYVIESATLFDFYPQTAHVETYVRFRLP